jgi:hypothetical protein
VIAGTPRRAARLRMTILRVCVLELVHGYGDAKIASKLRMSLGQLALFRHRNAMALEECYAKVASLVAEKAAGKRPTEYAP